MLNRSKYFILLAALAVSGCASTPSSNYDSAETRRADQADLHTRIAWNYLRREQYRVAGEELDRALKTDPGHSGAYHVYGVLSSKLNNFQDAERYFSRAVKLDPNNLDAQEDYAGFLCTRGRIDEALARYEAAMANPLNTQPAGSRTRAGLCMLRGGQFAEAERVFREALELNQNLRPAIAGMVRVSYERGNYMSARAYAERFLASGEPASDVLYYASQTEKMLGDRALAASYAKELRQSWPNSEHAKLLKQ